MARETLRNIAKSMKAVQEKPSVEQSFLADLKQSIEMQSVKNRRIPSKAYKPSSMQCIRCMYYQVTGTTQDAGYTPYALVGITNSGTDIHARLQQAVIDMKSNGIDCEYLNVAEFVKLRRLTFLNVVKEPDFEHGDYETKLFDTVHNISFLCDGIIKYQNQYFILELKTESSNKFMMRKGVDKKHYDQGTAYSLLFGLDNVIFIYISRDVLDMKAFMFTPTDDMKADVLDRIASCDEFVAQGKVPPKPKMDARVCQYCGYRTRCEGEDENNDEHEQSSSI